MGFLVGVLILFLLAKYLFPAIVVYILLVVVMICTVIAEIERIAEKEASPMEIIGAIIFMLLVFQLWKWV